MIIRVDVLQVLQHKLFMVPLRMPQRIEHITQLMKEYVRNAASENLYVSLNLDLPNGDVDFRPIADHVMYCSSHLKRHEMNYNVNLEAPVLIPLTTSCCKKKFRLDPWFAIIRVYTENGVLDGIPVSYTHLTLPTILLV